MISFEAPEAIKMVEKTLRGLYEEEPKKPRRRARGHVAAAGDEDEQRLHFGQLAFEEKTAGVMRLRVASRAKGE